GLKAFQDRGRRRLASLPSCDNHTRHSVLKLKRQEDFIINSDKKVDHLLWQKYTMLVRDYIKWIVEFAKHNGTLNFGRSLEEYINKRCFEIFT
ncbi:hypothetical protein ZWY2020_009955, partial [Hordeum vulgare]